MKTLITNFSLSLFLLTASATLTSAIPAPTPAATALVARSNEDQIFVNAARAQLRPEWRPAPEPTSASSSAHGLGARGPVFRRAAESKFQYRRRTSAGLAAAGNLAYNLEERDVVAPFAIGNHVPLPMRLKREAILAERDDGQEEDWDCSDYEDGDDDTDEAEASDDISTSSPSPDSSSASSASSAPSNSAVSAPEQTPSSLSTSQVPAPSANSQESSNESNNDPSPLLTNNVIGVVADSEGSGSVISTGETDNDNNGSAGSSSSTSDPTPESDSPDSAAPVSATSPKKSKKKQHKSHAKDVATKNPSDIAKGTLTVEEGCIRFHTVVAGEVCLGLLDWSKDLKLTLDQLYKYNPAIDRECTNLQIGWGVCIGAEVKDEAKATKATSSADSKGSSKQLRKKRNLQVQAVAVARQPLYPAKADKALVGDVAGEATFFSVGLGACGQYHTDEDAVVAIPANIFDSFSDPNSISTSATVCGHKINVCKAETCTAVTVTDRCEGCAQGDLDLSPSAFSALANPSEGRIPITWSWL